MNVKVEIVIGVMIEIVNMTGTGIGIPVGRTVGG